MPPLLGSLVEKAFFPRGPSIFFTNMSIYTEMLTEKHGIFQINNAFPATASPYNSCGPICLNKACSNLTLCDFLLDERSLLIPPYLTIFHTPLPLPPTPVQQLLPRTPLASKCLHISIEQSLEIAHYTWSLGLLYHARHAETLHNLGIHIIE